MLQKSRVSRFDNPVMRLAVSILPVMLLAATCAWASDTQLGKVALDATDGDPAPTGVRYMDVTDPPPFVLMLNPTRGEMHASLATPECPAFMFRDGFESGYLTQTGGDGTPILYVTTGGYLVQIDGHRISFQDPIARNKVEHWGDPHENLNGKHIKDWAGADGWDGTRRTISMMVKRRGS